MKALAKNVIGRLTSAARVDSLMLRRSAVVVAFHRVQDAPDPDGLSVDRAMFERLCRFFKDQFTVVPLADLVDRLERGAPVGRHLAITFDDGYRDNFENARPILEQLELPATFFVVSRWLDTNTWPWWDRAQGVRYPWMTWDQVVELSRRGFDIGAHTCTHQDLGTVGGAIARDEIASARGEIEGRIGKRVDLFAYPYGGPRHLSADNLALVKAAGYRCCCSCHGGLAPAGADPFRLHRVAISPWFSSPHQFGLEVVRASIARRAAGSSGCCAISEATGC